VLFEDDDGAVASADGGAPPVVPRLGEVDNHVRQQMLKAMACLPTSPLSWNGSARGQSGDRRRTSSLRLLHRNTRTERLFRRWVMTRERETTKMGRC
jgi:hypothetical protein